MNSPVAMDFADPLNSPYPVPWDWILRTQAEVATVSPVHLSQSQEFDNPFHGHFQWSPVLWSPDGRYAAYSLIQFYAVPQLFLCWVNSVCFLEDRVTGTIQSLSAHSPLAQEMALESAFLPQPGAIVIFQPAIWDHSGDRLLIRVFEAFFCSSEATDYGVLWNRQENRTQTVVPTLSEGQAAILLGWSPDNPEHILFQIEDFENSRPQCIAIS